MKIIIAGGGKLGRFLAKSLADMNNEITLIDSSYEALNLVVNSVDVNYVLGSATNIQILKQARVSESDLVISVMSSDLDNIVCTLLSQKLGVNKSITKVREPVGVEMIELLKSDLLSSLAINPDKMSAECIFHKILLSKVSVIASFGKKQMQLIVINISKASSLENQTLSSVAKKNGINIVTLERDNQILNKMNMKLKANDKIYIFDYYEVIQQFLKNGGLNHKIKSVMIVGGSKIAIYLSKLLLEHGIKVKIIEKDIHKCQKISELLPDALIIHADASNQSVLFEAGLESCDVFVSLTSYDEENIVYSMFARLNKIPKIVTKINHIELKGILENIEIGTIISPHKITSLLILNYIKNFLKENSYIDFIYPLDNPCYEIRILNVSESFSKLKMRLKDGQMKNLSILAIIRKNKIIFPSKNECVFFKDNLLIIAPKDTNFSANDILE
ncbi:MAG: hypothetical protein E7164_00045 [Firmicutes bacterium]|nr:hypothetical protein [Bacillota bacterium]